MLIWARQIKAGRCLVGWQQFQLAVAAGVGIATIRRIERMTGTINAPFETVERFDGRWMRPGLSLLESPSPVCVFGPSE